MGILLSLLTAVLYGVSPTFIGKVKTKPLQQIIGTCIGLFIVALITFAFTFKVTISDLQAGNVLPIVLISIASGMFLAFANFFQYKSYSYLGTSIGFALTTAAILVLNSVFSYIIFKSWQTPYQLGLGFSSLAIIIVGVFLISFKDKMNQPQESTDDKSSKKKTIIGLIIILLSGIMFAAYMLTPSLLLVDNPYLQLNQRPDATTVLLFQSIGGLIGSLFIVIYVKIFEAIKSRKESFVLSTDSSKVSSSGLLLK